MCRPVVMKFAEFLAYGLPTAKIWQACLTQRLAQTAYPRLLCVPFLFSLEEVDLPPSHLSHDGIWITEMCEGCRGKRCLFLMATFSSSQDSQQPPIKVHQAHSPSLSQTSWQTICSAKYFSYNNHSLLNILVLHWLLVSCMSLGTFTLWPPKGKSLLRSVCTGAPTRSHTSAYALYKWWIRIEMPLIGVFHLGRLRSCTCHMRRTS